jgi:hypothetical protein
LFSKLLPNPDPRCYDRRVILHLYRAATVQSLWQSLLKTALVGTSQAPFALDPSFGLEGDLGSTLNQLQAKEPVSEALLLKVAGILALAQKVGQRPLKVSPPLITPAEAEEWPVCSERARECLDQMLSGDYPQVLAEWIQLAYQTRQRVPEMNLPDLLDWGGKNLHLREAIRAVVGKRGIWLTQYHPDWHYLSDPDPDTWETGTPILRKTWLKQKRIQDPEAAREALITTWKQDPAADRVAFLDLLKENLSMADEPFLEKTLNDRSKEVRRTAAELLACLPESRFCQRMIERVQTYLPKAPSFDVALQRLTLPSELDSSLQRDGISIQKESQGMGTKAQLWQQVLAATPLTFWTSHFQMDPEALLARARMHEFSQAFLKGWEQATLRQQDSTWAQAFWGEKFLMDRFEPHSLVSWGGLLALLPDSLQADMLTRLLQSPSIQASPGLGCRILQSWKGEFSLSMGQAILQWIQTMIEPLSKNVTQSWEVAYYFPELALWIPPLLLQDLRILTQQAETAGFRYWIPPLTQSCRILEFRQEVHQSISLRP